VLLSCDGYKSDGFAGERGCGLESVAVCGGTNSSLMKRPVGTLGFLDQQSHSNDSNLLELSYRIL